MISRVAFDLEGTSKSHNNMFSEKLNPKSEANLGIQSEEVVFQDKNELKDDPIKPPAVIK